MLLDAAVLCIVVGLLAGGRLGKLKALDLRAPWAFVLAAAAQVGLMIAGARGTALGPGVAPALYVLTFVLVLVGLWINRHLPGVWLVGAGVFLNFLVIATNGGGMPVEREVAVRAGNTQMVEMLDSPAYTSHVPATEATRLRFLGDVLPLPMVIPRPRFFSPGSVGDVLVTLGACWLILSGLGAFGMGASGRAGSNDTAGASGRAGSNDTAGASGRAGSNDTAGASGTKDANGTGEGT